MKKVISLFLVLAMCLSLCACGKSEAVKNVEAMIDALGEITLESIDAIRSAEDAYDALTEDEQKKVGNYKTLTEARDAYYELALVGEWVRNHISIYDVESNYEAVSIILNSDMTGTQCEDGNNPLTWSVVNSQLCLDMGHYQNTYNIIEEDGILYFHYYEQGIPQENITWQSDSAYLAVSDFHALLDEMFLIVDFTEVDVNDYCELYLLDHVGTNEWGEPNGWGANYVMVGSTVYDEGWYCFSYSDIVIEVMFPEYTFTRTYPDGSAYEYTEEATTHSLGHDKFLWYYVHPLTQTTPDYTESTDVTIDQFSIGRAKGKAYYINKEYVQEIITDTDSQWSRQIVLKDGTIIDGFYDSDLWCDEHPY